MSIQNEIDRITQNIENTYAVLAALGADMTSEQNSDNLAAIAGTAKVVLYKEQSLEEAQKMQVRRNIGALSESELPSVINTALAKAKASGEFDGKDGVDGEDGGDGVSATHSWNGTVLTVTSASGTSSADLKGAKGDKGDSIKGDKGDTGAAGTSVTVKSVSESTADGGSNVVTFSDGKTVTIKNGDKGDNGQRGTRFLHTTTSPDMYTTPVGGVTPKYRIKLDILKSQAKVEDVFVGDTIMCSYYYYPIIYVDTAYAYTSNRVSIRGGNGMTPEKGTDYWTDADKTEMVNSVKSELPTLTVTGVDADGTTHTWTMYGVVQ